MLTGFSAGEQQGSRRSGVTFWPAISAVRARLKGKGTPAKA
jgi:hypothetical protein